MRLRQQILLSAAIAQLWMPLVMFHDDDTNTTRQNTIKKVEWEGSQIEAAHIQFGDVTPLRVAQDRIECRI